MLRSTLVFRAALVLGTSVLVAACSSKTSDTGSSGGVGATSTAAAVAGAADTHCAGQPVVVVDEAVCHNPPADPDAGATPTDGGAMPMAEFGATLYNSEGDDDDCKYHAKWQSTTVALNTDVTLSLNVTTLSDNRPLSGAKPYAEIYLSDTHGAPNTPVATTEVAPGSYTIGPVRFDARGTWTVRFHFRSDCDDSPTSPHGHVAFFVKVP